MIENIPLNKAATEAIQRLCEQHPDAECIICSSKGDMIPPERLERTFYRILKNVGINQAGLHSLRHTFASMLFKEKVWLPRKKINGLITDAALKETGKLPNSAMTLGDINRRLEELEAEFDALFNQSGGIDKNTVRFREIANEIPLYEKRLC